MLDSTFTELLLSTLLPILTKFFSVFKLPIMAKRSRALSTSTTATPATKRTRSSESLPQRVSQRSLSPRQALAAVSQATTFESQLLESQPEAEIVAPAEGSEAGTAATEARSGDRDDINGDSDNFKGIA